MKHLGLTLLLILLCTDGLFAQNAGNLNYNQRVRLNDQNINVRLGGDNEILFSVKGLANVKADTYVAIFSLAQVGKSTKEVNQLFNDRLSEILPKIKQNPNVETAYVDMVSFVPMYEYEVEKKTFSKKTYQEVPIGFELKKNLHIKYQDSKVLAEMMTILAESEIYDLVRVDYFASNMETTKRQLHQKAKIILQEKFASQCQILGITPENLNRRVSDGYKVLLPVEMYQSYEAYNTNSLTLNPKKTNNVNQVQKARTLYYQPVLDKEFDFVINPVVLEPVIQVLYEIKFAASKKPDNQIKGTDKYLIVTPNGEVKPLNIDD